MKRLLSFLIIILALIIPFTSMAATPEFDGSEYNIDSYMLVDAVTGDVLAEHNADEQIYPASTTKLMTALLLLEKKGLDGEITVGPEVSGFSSGSSLMKIKDGETLTVKDLFYGLMIVSGNDAAAAIAVYVSGSVDAFCDLMNERAQELGMTNTHFVNPHGMYINQTEENTIDEAKLGYHHYTTAADMAKLAVEAAKHPEIMEAAATPTYTRPATELTPDPVPYENSNRLLHAREEHLEDDSPYLYEPATGMKTGYVLDLQMEDGTNLSYYGALVASAEKDNTPLIAVMFGDRTDKAPYRWSLAKDLFEYGFTNYERVDLSQYMGTVSEQVQIDGAVLGDEYDGILTMTADPAEEMPDGLLLDKEMANGLRDGSVVVESKATVDDGLAAPIEKGQKVGSVSYTLNGEDLCTVPLLADRQVLDKAITTGRVVLDKDKDTASNTSAGGTNSGNSAGLPWWIWLIIIPAGLVAALFIIRAINLSRAPRHRRRRTTRPRANTTYTSPARRRGYSSSLPPSINRKPAGTPSAATKARRRRDPFSGHDI